MMKPFAQPIRCWNVFNLRRIFLFALAAFTLGHSPLPASAQLLPPVLISPPNNAQLMLPGRDFTVTLSWQEVEGASEYVVSGQVSPTGRNSILMGPLSVTSSHYILSLKHEDIGGQATVHWSVQARMPDGTTSAPSEVYLFTLGLTGTPIPGFQPSPTPLPAPRLIQPADGTEIREESLFQPVLFSWSPVEGAASYELVIFLENRAFFRTTTVTPALPVSLGGAPPIETTYQWHVQAIGPGNLSGRISPRGYFRIGGSGLYPTPTPLPQGMDHNGDGRIGGIDLFFLASRYRTNDPAVDYTQSGLNERRDLLHFIQRFHAERQSEE